MMIVRTIPELRDVIAAIRRQDERIALVPTMGSFHDGHLALMHAARAQADRVVVSLFVNPTQFGRSEDLAAYPRDEQRDLALASDAGADIVFCPTVTEMYPHGFATAVEVGNLASVLCGAHRGPGHFRGVATVVTKLLTLTTPDFAIFGQKDAQQALIIRRLAQDLGFATEIIVHPTIREADGLAMSSRNAYLDPAARSKAPALYRALQAASDRFDQGERSTGPLMTAAQDVLTAHGIEPEYLELRAMATLGPITSVHQPALLAVAARVGAARLIDNIILGE